MKKVPLSQGKVAWIDDEDAERVLALKWRVTSAKRKQRYAVHTTFDPNTKEQKTLLLHRFILNAQAGQLVDHQDGNGLNCQRENIRIATHSQNSQNRTTKKKYKGVFIQRGRRGQKPFYSQLTHNYKKINLGWFATPEAAARAYDAQARETFGEFARLNFPAEAQETR